jgi:hypothetical protein
MAEDVAASRDHNQHVAHGRHEVVYGVEGRFGPGELEEPVRRVPCNVMTEGVTVPGCDNQGAADADYESILWVEGNSI